jgi:hypothetical protein
MTGSPMKLTRDQVEGVEKVARVTSRGGLEGSETDLDEVTAHAVFELAATEETRQIEAELRKALEGRAS